MAPLGDLTVLTVLRSGGDLRPEYVYRLRDDVARNLPVPHRFACLTDIPLDSSVESWPFRYSWPRHYGKVEMFDPRHTGRILFLDLSVWVVGSLEDMATQSGVCITRDFYHGTPSQSIVLYDSGDFAEAFQAFRDNADEWMAIGERHRAPDFYDQVVMNRAPVPSMRYWQDILPGHVLSWRADCGRGIPPDARVIKFHGKPKPWEVSKWRALRN